jgi:hypothetical protein
MSPDAQAWTQRAISILTARVDDFRDSSADVPLTSRMWQQIAEDDGRPFHEVSTDLVIGFTNLALSLILRIAAASGGGTPEAVLADVAATIARGEIL